MGDKRRSDIKMVDVSPKDETLRTATAKGFIRLKKETMELIEKGEMKKGDVLATAQVAGVMAVKKTPDLIPLCHPLRITGVDVEFEVEDDRIEITVTVKSLDRTGVEMEALSAVSAAALTIYDMCKWIDKSMRITDIRLIEKTGGSSGDFRAE